MLKLEKIFKKRRHISVISDSLYEDYLKMCRSTGELPLNKEEFAKRLRRKRGDY